MQPSAADHQHWITVDGPGYPFGQLVTMGLYLGRAAECPVTANRGHIHGQTQDLAGHLLCKRGAVIRDRHIGTPR